MVDASSCQAGPSPASSVQSAGACAGGLAGPQCSMLRRSADQKLAGSRTATGAQRAGRSCPGLPWLLEHDRSRGLPKTVFSTPRPRDPRLSQRSYWTVLRGVAKYMSKSETKFGAGSLRLRILNTCVL